MRESENELRPRIRAGDRDAFAELYEKHSGAVYRHALWLTADWATAEDVMSETFLTAWRAREHLEPEGGPLTPWLLGIATHKAENARRGIRRRLAFLGRQRQVPVVADFAGEVAGRVDDARRLQAVQGALDRLRRHEREVLTLCVWSGLDYQQTADALGIPVGTVRSRLSRARARLARLADEKTPSRTEPGTRHGEMTGEAALAALPMREETT
ncbi:RNA polymerase sigma factor [Streptomyces sp. NBC_00178]|uniref:RNA polymerase sigma factor n=1 Tax=Streptomyces sp. NBC_00178 TaxID=2975672 RepID=UPI002E2D7CE5|nr:RNA polymerase sigma factor [Streptomyces sp. NBC_00178]